jgi:hypothetical protein
MRRALQGIGLKSAELGRSVGKAHAPRALELARAGELHCVGHGKDEWFYAADPDATLDRIVPELLREKGPLSEAAIKARVKASAPGHDRLVKDWLAGALARSVIFPHAARTGSKGRLFGAEPDPATVPPSDDELRARVRSAVSGVGLSQKQLSEKLGKAHAPRALALARELAAAGELWRQTDSKDEWFFGFDPVATLDRVVTELLREKGALTEADIKAQMKARAPGHHWLVKDWLKGATGRRVVFAQPAPGLKTKKAFGLEPDLKVLLGKPLADLQKAIGTVERSGVSREAILDFLRRELGAGSAPPKRASREVFLEALRRFAADNPSGALLPVRELRERAGLGKQDFDAAALALSNEGLLELHHHDHAAALSEAEQSGLVRDALGRHYVGIALRGSA